MAAPPEAADFLTLGVDLGGTKVETALVDAAGGIVTVHRTSTDAAKGPAGVITDIVECVHGCLGSGSRAALALGVGVAGQVEAGTGAVRFAPNLGWRDVPLREELERALGLPVAVVNDVRAAAWGEWLHGTGQGVDGLVCLFLGTGVGGGVITGGRILEGITNTAGELGHMTVVADGRLCRCRNLGCLEAYAGGWAIAQRAQEAVEADPDGGRTLISLAGDLEGITALEVSEAFRQGDRLARRVVDETGRYLSAGLVSIVNAFNPSLVILGGGVIEGLPELVAMAEERVRKYALEAAIEGLSVSRAALGLKAGVIGAAALARRAIREAP